MPAETTDPHFDSAVFLKNLTTRPGIYMMLNVQGEIIYIGKAKNLKNRVSSYFKKQTASTKQQVMVTKVAAIEVTVTHTEGEALLLECQQIKRHKPRYNICLRDDRSFPYVYLDVRSQISRRPLKFAFSIDRSRQNRRGVFCAKGKRYPAQAQVVSRKSGIHSERFPQQESPIAFNDVGEAEVRYFEIAVHYFIRSPQI